MEEKRYLSFGKKISYGFGMGGQQFVNTIINSFILIFMTDTVGLSAGIIGTLMLAAKVFDGFSDIIFGSILSKTNTKIGKARPWIIISMVPLGLAEVLNFCIPQNANSSLQYVYFFVFYVLYNAVFYTIGKISVDTFSFYITKNGQERIQLGAIGYIIGTVVQVVCSSLTTVLVNAFGGGLHGWRAAALVFAVLGVICFAICAFGNKELPEFCQAENQTVTKAKKEHRFVEDMKALVKNKYFFVLLICLIVFNLLVTAMMTTAAYYAKYHLHNESLTGILTMIILIPVIVANFFVPALTKKLGLYKTNKYRYWGGFFMSIICLIFALKAMVIPLFVCMFIRSLGMGPFASTQNAIVAQLCEYSELKDGAKIEGMLFSCTSVGVKVGGGIASAVVGWMLTAGGYVGTAASQTPGALRMIIIVFAGLPAILTLINALLLGQLKVESAMEDLRKEKGL